MYAVTPIKILLSPSLSPTSKMIYAYIVYLSGKTGKCKFTLHHFAVTFGLQHGIVKISLNELAKNGFIWRDGENISLVEPEVEDAQIEADYEFAGEVVRLWNKVFKRDLQVGIKNTPELSGAISNTMSSFSGDEIILAVERWKVFCDNDDWWNKDENRKHKTNIMKFFEKSERLNQALNFKSGTNIVQKESEGEDKSLLN